ncbi:ATP-binding protein [Dyella sp.]|uniref:ATP-binding protein n=1 Tax=Dyella sp. TaxID=1869338 RepID=UPI002D7835D2|nr:ATP-binding protein [Dyella sp.]HET7333275.1 ATP-binding protein [Dyella sp.]
MIRLFLRILLLLLAMAGWAGALHARQLVLSAQEQQWIKGHPQVRFAVGTQLKPVSYVDDDGVYKGVSAQYLAAIEKKTGLHFQLVHTDGFSGAKKAIADGAVDLLPVSFYTRLEPDVRERVLFTEPYFSSPSVIVTRADNPSILDPHELEGKRVAIYGDNANVRFYMGRLPSITPVLVAGPQQGLEALVHGEADAALGSAAVQQPLVRQKYSGQLGIAGVVDDLPVNLQMAVRKDEPLLYSILAKTLKSLSAEETDVLNERALQEAGYGAPTLRSLVMEYLPELAAACIAGLLLIWFAYRARVAKRQAEQSELAKSRFLAVMSHEIRTPMNAILASIEMLQQSPLEPNQRKLALTASTASEALLGLLDDVLDLSKLDAHRLELETMPTDIERLAQKVVDVVTVKARDKALPMHLFVDNPSGAHAVVDPTRLRQILLNLLGNAVKFTQRGSITLDVRVEGVQGHPGRVHARVRDTGIGIAKDQQAKLFQAYVQADSATTRQYGGTGLGLTICKELVELMGGQISLESTQDVGTTVSFSIPARLVAASMESEVPSMSESAVSLESGGQVLVVEDHPQNRFVMAEQLRALSVDTIFVADGRAAIETIGQHPISLVLMDCHMPEMDGYETTRRIRQRETSLNLPRVPVIAISAATDAAHLKRCMDSGMDSVLKKPLRLDELRSMLGLWMDRLQSVESVAPPAAENQSIDMFELYKASIEEDAQALKDALAKEDRDNIIHFAHRIKGAALMIGAEGMAQSAGRLEELVKAANGLGVSEALQALQEEIAKWIALRRH